MHLRHDGNGNEPQRISSHTGGRNSAWEPQPPVFNKGLNQTRRNVVGIDDDVPRPPVPPFRARHVHGEDAPLAQIALRRGVGGVEQDDGEPAVILPFGHEGETGGLAHEIEIDRDHAPTSPRTCSQVRARNARRAR